jgi:hypothetical protein
MHFFIYVVDSSVVFIIEDNQQGWIYGNASLSPKSSLLIRAGSLKSNRTYEFLVYMKNRLDSSIDVTSYVLIRITETQLPQVIIRYEYRIESM